MSQLWDQHPQDQRSEEIIPIHREEGQLPQQTEEDQVK